MSQPLTTQDDDDPWFCAGPVSSFPDLASTTHNPKIKLSNLVSCAPNNANTDTTQSPAAKIFQIPPLNPTSTSPFTNSQPFQVTPGAAETSTDLEQQILVFQHRGKFHAIDHQCPHRSYSLSLGSVYDIEDFGIVLSAGVMCPKHGWAFDLFTGESDRGSYQLRIWDVEVRERRVGDGDGVREVWVKRR